MRSPSPPRRATLHLTCLACLAATSILATGCGATSLRVTGSPTLDTGARVGFEVTVSAGMGWPLSFKGRSHDFIQGRITGGGGLDGRSQKGLIVAGGELDVIHWAEPVLDLRAGVHLLYRELTIPQSNLPYANGGAIGGHVGVYPIVAGSDAGWMVFHFHVGPEMRFEYVWSGVPSDSRAMASVPLVAEAIFLAAGD